MAAPTYLPVPPITPSAGAASPSLVPTDPLTVALFGTYSREQLKGLCKEHGLSTNGIKMLLCSRLLEKTDHPTLVASLTRLRGVPLVGAGIYPPCPFGLEGGELTVLSPPPGGAAAAAGEIGRASCRERV